jgi:hypothetical protein
MNRPIPAAYRGAVDSPCPTCGAEPGEFCLIDDDRRCPPSTAEVEHQAAPAPPTRSFSEPIHSHDPED